MPRPQFSIRTLLWLTLVVAAFLGGAAWQRTNDHDEIRLLEKEVADKNWLIESEFEKRLLKIQYDSPTDDDTGPDSMNGE